MLLNIAHTSQKKQEEGDGNGAEKGGCYHHAGGQSAFVAHVFGHDVAADGGGRA